MDIDIELLIRNVERSRNIVTCSSHHKFDFLENVGNAPKFIDLYRKSAGKCWKNPYDNWLLSYNHIVM